ncbi:LytTR family DNA-binding domain-containing protein [Pontixanthobacter gangjinensis]|uniref:HTH LytTR-type domain-containing protein n=1 Tax=Pontixanthobacter gangjinensis TaxID=1028742 RepID=A0A6I4SR96_9SPHN|nr:LytTR family DNA-binding domain-containing protein [Pontixanthobacter gangjinensis]MXO57660.1 hypothetical protein [Pontixanthobacter gangjinensis]
MLIMTLRTIIAGILCLSFLSASAHARSFMDYEEVAVCPALSDEHSPPDFSGPNCETVSAFEVDPQEAQIWIRGNIRLENRTGPENQPLALFVSGKMASEVYLNGEFIGRNGRPGIDANDEIPGLMDATFYLDQSLLRVGNNEVLIKASSHRGYLHLENPIHMIAIGVSRPLTDDFLRHYVPSLLTLGIFILGAVFFGVMGLIGPARRQAITFSLMCLFTAGQLVAEVYRGIDPYLYPTHDFRLAMIVLFSASFGLTVAFHVLSTFRTSFLFGALVVTSALTTMTVYLAPGFDQKAEFGMLVPMMVSLIATGFWTYQRINRAFVYFLILATFVTAILVFPSLFLDRIFYYLVAAFLLLLFVEKGFALARETREHALEARRADRLALALEQANERDDGSEIAVSSAGRIDRIKTNEILFCRSAGGYAEMVLVDGRVILHSATLSELEETLPQTFLRVHRSFLVNSKFVQKLDRDAAGTGTLTLEDGAAVPVSRRIMPQVRQALS